MGEWLGMDADRSNNIEDSEPLHGSLPAINHMNTHDKNIAGTRTMEAARSEETRTKEAVKNLRKQLQATRTVEPHHMQETMTAEPEERQPRPRPSSKFIPPRLKSQIILHKRLSETVKGPGSSLDNEIVLEQSE
ncbi:hypothetical protein Tco_0682693 [Tanacetum coccineum]|uniref:Uncharacterized protein n=1 Tax=Tanacetum coccineum TaxID=301880 RepID=A0ABQ4XRW3_9ASTR